MKIFFFAMVLTIICAGIAEAGPIKSACLDSNRGQSAPGLCGCIQQVADMTLQGADQRRAARFFANPDRAQQVRMSSTAADNAFWRRYVSFGDAAAQQCSP